MLVNTGISYPEENNGRRKHKLTTTVPPKLYEYVKSKVEIHGSMSAYLRYLILTDLNGEKTTPKQIHTQKITSQGPPAAPSGNAIKNTCTRGYASLHSQLMTELKAKIKRIE
ncbi:MAG: hypothetical protein ACTSP1_13705 [Candidatus Freyarchaeota archaeon]|nr:hypothetical protein [Candidatus Freyarchaeota archaeon]